MWVLEARANAEKITYPVVWEEVKDASNVIDYDIRSEETKDVSAEINANNQTTTGMATVIPWINAPKLIETTSIISKKDIWYIAATVVFRSREMTYSWESSPFVPDTITDEEWAYKFYIDGEFLYIPADWWYQLDITRPQFVYATGNSSYWITTLECREWTIATDTWDSQSTWRHTSTETVKLTKWNWLHWYWTIVWNWTGTKHASINIHIKRIWDIWW